MKETIDHSNCLRLAGSHIFKHPAVNPEQIQLESKSGNKTWKFIPRFEVCFFHNHESLTRPNHSQRFTWWIYFRRDTSHALAYNLSNGLQLFAGMVCWGRWIPKYFLLHMQSAINSTGTERLPIVKLETTLGSSKYCFFPCILSLTPPCPFHF